MMSVQDDPDSRKSVAMTCEGQNVDVALEAEGQEVKRSGRTKKNPYRGIVKVQAVRRDGGKFSAF